MANSRYEYVKKFEKADGLLPSTYIVVRIDGRGFHRASKKYNFGKPNDRRALDLMNAAAKAVTAELHDIFISYGVSDEYSFVLERSCDLFERRESKLVTTIVSTFSSYYIFLWPEYFPDISLSPPLPSFDGRAILYPTKRLIRDYLSWRQVDCHINNLYNTTFWALVLQGGLTATEAEEQLKGSVAADKNEILFSRFNINYNNEPDIFKKGTIIYRENKSCSQTEEANDGGGGVAESPIISKTQVEKRRKLRAKINIVCEHVDLIRDEFWQTRPWLLSLEHE